MAHPCKLIEKALAALLVEADTAAGSRVSRNRLDPYKKGSLPAISVYFLSEETDRAASDETSPRLLKRVGNFEIVGFVRGRDEEEVSDAMFDIAEEIEAAMDAEYMRGTAMLGGLAEDLILAGTVREIREGQSDPLIGTVALTYSVTYRTSPAAPADLDDFRTVAATHRIVGADDDNAAHDEFAVQETP